MGLDVSHGAFSGACSAFNRLRQFVLKSVGGSYPPHTNANLDDNFWYWESDFGNIENYNGLCEFLNHSDCDGTISPDMCKAVSDELEAIMPNMELLAKTEKCNGHILRDGGYINVIKQFIQGCKSAYESGEELIFR